MTAADYGINFGYKAQDGYYYGINGIVGKYHRGNDRPCPSGTPIVIEGVTIGWTGATGIVSGAHLHTQACTAGANWSNDLDPGMSEFKPGTVVAAAYHSQFGNYVMIRVGGVDITYAHLSKINVSVGQVIGGNPVIPDNEAWYYRMKQLMLQIRGRDLSREEFQKNFVGVQPFRMVEVLSDDIEAANTQNAQVVGQVALRDNWQGQIQTLSAQVAELGNRPTADQLETLNKQILDLQLSAQNAQTQAEVAKKEADDAKRIADQITSERQADVETGNSFLRWLGNLLRLGK